MNQSLGSRVQTGSEAGETQDAARDYRDFVEKAHRMTDSDIARRLWEEREETFPPRLRRKPDAMVEITGTWKIFRDVDPASRPLLGGRA